MILWAACATHLHKVSLNLEDSVRVPQQHIQTGAQDCGGSVNSDCSFNLHRFRQPHFQGSRWAARQVIFSTTSHNIEYPPSQGFACRGKGILAHTASRSKALTSLLPPNRFSLNASIACDTETFTTQHTNNAWISRRMGRQSEIYPLDISGPKARYPDGCKPKKM